MYIIRYSNITYEDDSNRIVIFYKTSLGYHVIFIFGVSTLRIGPEGLGIQFQLRGLRLEVSYRIIKYFLFNFLR